MFCVAGLIRKCWIKPCLWSALLPHINRFAAYNFNDLYAFVIALLPHIHWCVTSRVWLGGVGVLSALLPHIPRFAAGNFNDLYAFAIALLPHIHWCVSSLVWFGGVGVWSALLPHINRFAAGKFIDLYAFAIALQPHIHLFLIMRNDTWVMLWSCWWNLMMIYVENVKNIRKALVL